MKCYFCGNDSDYLTTDGKPICHRCTESLNYTICPEKGAVIADSQFYCDKICNDCIYDDRKNKIN